MRIMRAGVWVIVGVLVSIVGLAGASPAYADGPAIAVPGTTLLVGVACATATDCVAAGQAGVQTSGVVVSITNGGPGGAQSVSGTNELYGTACSSTTDCLAVGVGNGATEGVVVPITNGTAGASVPVSGTAFLRGVTCWRSTDCVAVGWQVGNYNDGNGRIGVVVPITSGVPGAVEQVTGTLDIDSVACSSGSDCVGVGTGAAAGSGTIVPITDGAAGAAQTLSGTLLLGVSCSTSSDCLAVGASAAGGAAVVPITNGAAGAAEPVSGLNALSGVDCADTSCEAVGWFTAGSTGGAVEISGGTPGTVQPESGTFQLYGVACPTDTGCLATGDNSSNGEGIVTSVSAFVPKTPNKTKAKLTAAFDFLDHFYSFDTLMCLSAADTLLRGGGYDWGDVHAFFDEMCGDAISELVDDFLTFLDPPDNHYRVVARVASAAVPHLRLLPCARVTPARRQLCQALDQAFLGRLAAEQKVLAVSAAIKKTVARDAAAQSAGNQAAVTLQEKKLASLEKQLASAVRTAAKSGVKLVHLLREAGASARVTKSAYAKGVAALYRRLAHRGISNTDVAKILNGKKPPSTPPTLFAALAQG
jgi:hypothetical protein